MKLVYCFNKSLLVSKTSTVTKSSSSVVTALPYFMRELQNQTRAGIVSALHLK